MRTGTASLPGSPPEAHGYHAVFTGSSLRAVDQSFPAPIWHTCGTFSKHHLICDGKGTPLHVITTAANVNDITQTINLVDGIPPVAGRPGRPRRRPESVLGDKACDSKAVRRELRRRRILPVISRKGAPDIKGLGNSATSSSRPSPCSTSSNALPSDGNGASNSTTPYPR
ncbi:transposase [Streptomyces sp. NBC_00055]|uniref:transposase n=1 Tax=unclassified Streptomyces TaxID=2593676 RepID=UPI003863ABDA